MDSLYPDKSWTSINDLWYHYIHVITRYVHATYLHFQMFQLDTLSLSLSLSLSLCYNTTNSQQNTDPLFLWVS